MKKWSLLVFLVGRSHQAQVLEQMREVTWCVLRVMCRQCKVHTSQRLRRAIQLYSVYSRMWGEEVARSMLGSLRHTLISRGRSVLMSALCLNSVDWEKEKIPDERMQRSSNDLDSVGELCRATVQCGSCGKRQVIDQQMSNVEYCMCGGSVGYTSEEREFESWHPFIEREHHIVWRRRHPVYPHLYAYKVYGSYDDVCLSAFMEVQLNCHYRTEWDDTAIQLRVLGSHTESNSDLVYWLVKFPAFFSNRDYIFKRRFAINESRREVVIMSEAVAPDMVAEEKGVHRVNEYWSTMVIRARHSDISKPGLEYTLTYFDNPGTSLPQSITNFIAATGFPNFLKKLHSAALSLQSVYEEGRDVYVSLPANLRHPRLKRRDALLEEPQEPIDYKAGEVAVLSQSKGGSLEAGNIDSKRSIKSMKSDMKLSEALSDMKLSEGLSDTKKERIAKIGAEREGKSLQDSKLTSAVGEDITQDSSDKRISENHRKGIMKLLDDVMKLGQERKEESSHDTEESYSHLKHKSSLSDMSVNVGSKKVSVDLLEAMEVVAPELEGRALLLCKLEQLLGIKLDDMEKQSVIIEKLEKLKNMLKSFHERSVQKKERSLKKMEELANRDHYEHLIVDEKTLVQLELLFQAMRDVLQADKDMRTGKGLMDPVDKESTGISNNSKYSSFTQSKSSSNFKEDVKKDSNSEGMNHSKYSDDGKKVDSNSEGLNHSKYSDDKKKVDSNSEGVNRSKYSVFVQPDSSINFKGDKTEVDANLSEEEDLKNSLRKRKKDTSKTSAPPKDPPPPSSSTDPSKQTSEGVNKGDAGIGGGQSADRSDVLGDSDSGVDQSSSWINLPYISAWWESGKRKHEGNQSSSNNDKEEGRNIDERKEEGSNMGKRKYEGNQSGSVNNKEQGTNIEENKCEGNMSASKSNKEEGSNIDERKCEGNMSASKSNNQEASNISKGKYQENMSASSNFKEETRNMDKGKYEKNMSASMYKRMDAEVNKEESGSLAAQIWYIVTFGWIFNTEDKGRVNSNQERPENKGKVNSNQEKPENKGKVNSNQERPENKGNVNSNQEKPDTSKIYSKRMDAEVEEEITGSLAAQIWNIVTLRWIFNTEAKGNVKSNQEKPENKGKVNSNQEKPNTQEKEEQLVNKTSCDEESSTWYWYPVRGVYRVYAWVFSASRQSA